VSGHDFSRAVNGTKKDWALAPEVCFLRIKAATTHFSAARLPPRECQAEPLSAQTISARSLARIPATGPAICTRIGATAPESSNLVEFPVAVVNLPS